MGCTSSHLQPDLHVDSVNDDLPATSPPEPVPPVRPAVPSQAAAIPQRQQGSAAAEQSSSPVSPFRAAPAEQKDDSAFGDEEAEPETLPPPGFEKLSTQDRGKTNSLGELNRQYGFDSVMARQQKVRIGSRRGLMPPVILQAVIIIKGNSQPGSAASSAAHASASYQLFRQDRGRSWGIWCRSQRTLTAVHWPAALQALLLTLLVPVPLQLTAANRQSKLLSQLPDTRALDLGEVDTVAPSAASWTDALHRSSAGESRLSKLYADAGDTAVPEGDPVWNTTAVGELAVCPHSTSESVEVSWPWGHGRP